MLATVSGCALIVPEVAHRPIIRNPFPQLSRVAIAPFFNHSDEPTVDGREFATAYFAELQATPGFEVVPLGVTEEAIMRHRIDLSNPEEARRLAKLLGVDAVVIGAVTDFSPYYPPRCGMRVEWYTANVGFHEIPAGYGLPWNTPEEEFIPDSLVYESQMALARTEMAKQSPPCDSTVQPLPAPPAPFGDALGMSATDRYQGIRRAQAVEELPPGPLSTPPGPAAGGASSVSPSAIPTGEPSTIDFLPPQSGPESLASEPIPPAPFEEPVAAGCLPFHGPVLAHTRIYRGNDPDVTRALQGYVYFQDDARFGGWEGYLQRSNDFIRFCCHMHISEMLSARGGSRKTSVVWRWPENR